MSNSSRVLYRKKILIAYNLSDDARDARIIVDH
jgi:hypothetical protein